MADLQEMENFASTVAIPADGLTPLVFPGAPSADGLKVHLVAYAKDIIGLPALNEISDVPNCLEILVRRLDVGYDDDSPNSRAHRRRGHLPVAEAANREASSWLRCTRWHP